MRSMTSWKLDRKVNFLLLIICIVIWWTRTSTDKTSDLSSSTQSSESKIVSLFPKKRLIIWNNDNHPAPVVDAKRSLEPLGVDVRMHVLSDYCTHFNVCNDRLRLKVINKHNYATMNQSLVDAFFDAYKDDPTMNSVDAFLCYDPAFICELFEPFNRSIVLIFTGRYYFGRVHTGLTLTAWNRKLLRLSASPHNVIGANNLYDVNILRYYTGIEPVYVPNYCDYTGSTYDPVRGGYLLAKRRPDVAFLDWFERAYRLAAANVTNPEARRLLRIDRNYPTHNYSDLASHRGIVHLPYQISTMSVVEQYRMNVPLFFPSTTLLMRWNRERGVLLERLRMRVPIRPHPTQRHLPNPRNERSVKAMRYWLRYADYYALPHIVYFDSVEHLAELLDRLTADDLKAISEKMSRYNAEVKYGLLNRWKDILRTVAKYSPNNPK